MYVGAVGPDPPPLRPLHSVSSRGQRQPPSRFVHLFISFPHFPRQPLPSFHFPPCLERGKRTDRNGNWGAGLLELGLFLASFRALFRPGLRVAVRCLSSWYFQPRLSQPPFLGSSGRVLPKWPFALPVTRVYPRNRRPSGILKGIQVAQTPCAVCSEHRVPLHSAVRVAAFPAGNTLVSPPASDIIQFGPFTLLFQKLSPEGPRA